MGKIYVYINDSGHEMTKDDFFPYLALVKIELLEAGKTEKEIEEYINSFFDDCPNCIPFYFNYHY